MYLTFNNTRYGDKLYKNLIADEPCVQRISTGNGKIFQEYLKCFLLPELKEDQTLIMDNLSSHKSEITKKLIRSKRINLVYLPPYLNPIEVAWSKLKHYLTKRKTETEDKLMKAIKSGINKIRKPDCKNRFKHCGYLCQ